MEGAFRGVGGGSILEEEVVLQRAIGAHVQEEGKAKWSTVSAFRYHRVNTLEWVSQANQSTC